MATQEQYAQAGAYAARWFECLENTMRRAPTTEVRHTLENTILDVSLMEAGIIPRELPESSLIGGTTLIAQGSPEYPGRAL